MKLSLVCLPKVNVFKRAYLDGNLRFCENQLSVSDILSKGKWCWHPKALPQPPFKNLKKTLHLHSASCAVCCIGRLLQFLQQNFASLFFSLEPSVNTCKWKCDGTCVAWSHNSTHCFTIHKQTDNTTNLQIGFKSQPRSFVGFSSCSEAPRTVDQCFILQYFSLFKDC